MPAPSFPVGARSARAAGEGEGGADAQATSSPVAARARAMRRMMSPLADLAGRADPVDPLVDLPVVVAIPHVLGGPSGAREGAHDDRGGQRVAEPRRGFRRFARLVLFEGPDVDLSRRAIDRLREALLHLGVLRRATGGEDEQGASAGEDGQTGEGRLALEAV